MDFELFFSSPRWKILEILAEKPSSPLEISQKLGTTLSYVSQQLRFLEAANLVVKERTRFVEKGKPRTVFSLSKEILHITALIKDTPSKKTISLTDYHKIILRIWLMEDPELHYYVEKLYWKIEDDIREVKCMFVDTSSKKPEIGFVCDFPVSKRLKSKIEGFLKEAGKFLSCRFVSEADIGKIVSDSEKLHNIHPIYDPNLLLVRKEVKGGVEKRDEE